MEDVLTLNADISTKLDKGDFVSFIKDSEDSKFYGDLNENSFGYVTKIFSGSSEDYVSVAVNNSLFNRIPRKSIVLIDKAEKEKRVEQIQKESIQKFRSKESRAIQDSIKESLESIFPDNWDLQLSPIKDNMFGKLELTVIILFPEITIVNGDKNSHLIKDLYVKFKMNEKGEITSNLQGFRGTLSYIEAACGYRHSHLQRATIGISNSGVANFKSNEFINFCLGSSTMSESLENFRGGGFEFSQLEFELFLYEIDAYVRWESLQGGPYFRMSGIAIPGRNTYLREYEVTIGYKLLLERVSNFPCKFDKSSGRFEISKEDIEKKLKMKELTKVRRTPTGEYIYGDESPRTIQSWVDDWNNEECETLETFKGKPLEIKVENFVNNEDEIKNIEYVAHPQITEYVTSKLVFEMNSYFTSNYGK